MSNINSMGSMGTLNEQGTFVQAGPTYQHSYEHTQFNMPQRNEFDMQINQQPCGLNGQSSINTSMNENWGRLACNDELIDMIKQVNNSVTAVSSRLTSIESCLGKLANIESDLSTVKFDVSNIKIAI